MVKISLEINATLENIEEIWVNPLHYEYFIKIKCTNCGELSDKWHGICEADRYELDKRNPKGLHFYMKCRLCNRENSIDIIENSNVKYTSADSNRFKSIVQFDCRGTEPVEFMPRHGWFVQSAENGQHFDDIDLSDDDWVEYDQINKTSIGIFEFRSRFTKLKK